MRAESGPVGAGACTLYPTVGLLDTGEAGPPAPCTLHPAAWVALRRMGVGGRLWFSHPGEYLHVHACACVMHVHAYARMQYACAMHVHAHASCVRYA